MALTVLVVEDDVPLRRLFRQALTFAGYTVYEAGDGYGALQVLENAARVDPWCSTSRSPQ